MTLALTVSTFFMLGSASLPDCPTEDSKSCYWNAQTRGDGQGISFISGPEER